MYERDTEAPFGRHFGQFPNPVGNDPLVFHQFTAETKEGKGHEGPAYMEEECSGADDVSPVLKDKILITHIVEELARQINTVDWQSCLLKSVVARAGAFSQA
jgi:hypothetical protein